MATSGVSLRLGMEGKEQIVDGFADIGASGDAAGKRAAAAFQRASDDIATATQRQAAAAQKLAAGGVSMGPNANQQVLDYRAWTKAQQEMEQQAQALRNAIDPLRVAQAQYDSEIALSAKLLAAGKISEQEHAAAVALSTSALASARRGVEEHTASMGLNRTQMIVAQSAVMRFTDAILAGQSPMRAFALEAHKIGEVASFDDGGVAGALEKVRAILTPTVVGLTAAAAATAVGTAAWVSYTNAVQRLNALAQGSGRLTGMSGDQFEAAAEAAAKAGDITVSAARNIETAYIQTGKIGGSVLTGLTGITTDFAAATGQKVDAAAAVLAKAFNDPAKGADELTQKYGILDAATLEYIHSLVEQGRETDAQAALLKALEKAFDGAAEHANLLERAWHGISSAASDAWTWMGKAIDRALGGGAIEQQLADLQRKRSLIVQNSIITPDTSTLDKQIASLQTQLRQTQDAKAKSDAVAGMKLVDSFTGADQKADLQANLSQINKLLADSGKAAGLSADQLASARDAQDAYTHAVESYLPPAEKQRQLDALDVQIAAARTPTQKAALAAQKARIEQSGKVVTSAQAEADAHAKGAAALATASKAGAGHAATLARDAAAMDVSARAALALADAYLQGGAAAVVAEARRKALTDATKKGVDADAQVQRQLALTVAETIAGGAKSVSTLRDQTAARLAANDNVVAGTLALGDLQHALSDEAALRPLLTLRTLAHGDALERLTKLIGDYRQALAAAHEQEKRTTALQAIQGSNDAIAGLQDQIEFAGDRTGQGQVEIARRAVLRNSDRYGASTDDVANAKVREVQAQQAADRAKYAADTLASQRDEAQLTTAELTSVTASADQRQLYLDRVRATIDLEQRGISLTSDQAKEILAGVDAQDELNRALERASAAMDEVRSFAGQFLDDLTSGRNVAQDLYAEFIKLAALNPLKNLLGGSHSTTLGDVAGAIGGLLGGVGAFTSSINAGLPSALAAGNASLSAHALGIPGYASGTDSAPGGLAWVAENGPELIRLPRGASVTPASQTRQMLSANNNQPVQVQVLVSEGQMFEARVVGISDTRIAAAAPNTVAAGGRMGQRLIDQRQRYSMRGV